MSGITIVVKGIDGSGRSQIVDIIKDALESKNFSDVAVLDSNKPTDIHTLSTPFRETPIIIAEG